MADVGIKISASSLSQFQKALKKIDTGLAKELKVKLKDAAEIVASDARGRVPVKSGTAAASIRSGSTLKGAHVSGGKKSVPYYGWLDFGSRTPVSGRGRSVGPWAGSGKGPEKGRFIYPALSDKFDQVYAAVEDAVDAATKGAGF